MTNQPTLTIDGKTIAINGERNLLEVIRKANIDLPTFCYHSELSVYGACRLCLVHVEGRGLMGACSAPAQAGMVVRTNTEEVREIRKISVELLLANHDQGCPTCPKSTACQLQSLAKRLGIEKVRFKSTQRQQAVDRTTPSLVRDPNKCVLCGDCVRMCAEVQGIGAIDFAYRGAAVTVGPAFGKDLGTVDCVYCGQCARVCPTGALTPASQIGDVWKALENPAKKVVAQIAPAVRVALGEMFGQAPGTVAIGQIVAALKAMGFDQVYDTAFTADMTVLEESNEFLSRLQKGARMPQFTSCCPGWVKYAEQYYPELLGNLSSCRSPQQMFGSLAKDMLPAMLGVEAQDVVVVSIMPCTAKKFEARRPEFQKDGRPDVDFVLTTQELGQMIEQAGLRFDKLSPESLDMPLGFKTGAGVIFGNSGGVSEAVLRYVSEKVNAVKLDNVDFHNVRGEQGIREATVTVGGRQLKLAVVHGLKNAREVAGQVKAGKSPYDFIEVMACPGGCVGGAGQPCGREQGTRQARAKGLYDADKMLQLHKSQDNYMVNECYQKHLGEVNGPKAHKLLHTKYQSRRRIEGQDFDVLSQPAARCEINVCVGTSCYIRGSQNLLHRLVKHIQDKGLAGQVDVKATFCFEACDRGPTIAVGDQVIEKCTLEKAVAAMESQLNATSHSS